MTMRVSRTLRRPRSCVPMVSPEKPREGLELQKTAFLIGAPYGIRTRVSALRGYPARGQAPENLAVVRVARDLRPCQFKSAPHGIYGKWKIEVLAAFPKAMPPK